MISPPAGRHILILALVLATGRVDADELKRLPAVEVSAEEPSLTLPGLDAARAQIERTPGGVGVVDAEQYKTGRASTLQDALGYSAGVFVQPRFGSDEARLSIRGSGLQRTFHLRGIKLLQDGVPLNQADGGGDFQAIEPLATRYIEVYRGANALRYGSSTLGGAINYVSPSGYDADPVQAHVEGGSFDYLRAQASTGGVRGKFDYYASLSHAEQDGFRDHARQQNGRLFSNLGLKLSDDLETRFYLAHVDSDSELPGNLTQAELDDDPTKAAPGNVTGDNKRDFVPFARISNKTTWRLSDAARVEFSAFYTHKHLSHPIFQVLDIVSRDVGAELRYWGEFNLVGYKNALTAGVSPVRGENIDRRFVNVGGSKGAPTNRLDQTADLLEVYVEDQFYLTSALSLIAGVQWTDTSREQDDELIAMAINESRDKDYSGASPKFGVLYDVSSDVQVFANVSESFEPPSFAELTSGPSVAPVFADAQTATTLEIGTRGELPHAAWDIALYRAEVDDELLSRIDPVTQAPLGTVNADQTLHQGLELGLVLRAVNDRLTWRQNYLWSDFNFDGDTAFGDNQLAGIPEHLYRAELLWAMAPDWYIGPTVEWAPEDYPVDHANTLFADGYSIYGVKLGYRAKTGFSWFVEGRNLTDEHYAASTGVIDNAKGMDSRQFLPGDGRSFFVGIEWRGG